MVINSLKKRAIQRNLVINVYRSRIKRNMNLNELKVYSTDRQATSTVCSIVVNNYYTTMLPTRPLLADTWAKTY